jgi:UPF0716 protein FxsA
VAGLEFFSPTPTVQGEANFFMRTLLLLLPWLELFTLIQLGVQTSALVALVYVFLTFVLGLTVLRYQGAGMFQRLREQQMGRAIGPELLVDDMALGFAGVLLMIPGLLTDIAAIFVAIGPLRRQLVRWLHRGERPDSRREAPSTDSRPDSITIEGDFNRLDD